MRRSSRWAEGAGAGERGSAPIEFIVAGMLLLAPLVYLMVALGAIQNQALGAQTGVRHIARSVATAVDADDARRRADAVLATVVDQYAMDAERVALDLRCVPAGASCPAAGATLVVTITTRVTLPLAPRVLGLDRLASIPVEASAVHRVSRFWGAP